MIGMKNFVILQCEIYQKEPPLLGSITTKPLEKIEMSHVVGNMTEVSDLTHISW